MTQQDIYDLLKNNKRYYSVAEMSEILKIRKNNVARGLVSLQKYFKNELKIRFKQIDYMHSNKRIYHYNVNEYALEV